MEVRCFESKIRVGIRHLSLNGNVTYMYLPKKIDQHSADLLIYKIFAYINRFKLEAFETYSNY